MVPTTLWVEVCAEFEVASRCALGVFRDGRDCQTPWFSDHYGLNKVKNRPKITKLSFLHVVCRVLENLKFIEMAPYCFKSNMTIIIEYKSIENFKCKLEMAKTVGPKGQIISKCPFGVKTSFKKPTKFKILSRISALASKKRSKWHFIPLIGGFYFDSLTLLFWFGLFLG